MPESPSLRVVNLCDSFESSTFDQVASELRQDQFPLRKNEVCGKNKELSISKQPNKDEITLVKWIYEGRDNPQDLDYVLTERVLTITGGGKGVISESRVDVQNGIVDPRSVHPQVIARDLRFDPNAVKRVSDLIIGKSTPKK